MKNKIELADVEAAIKAVTYTVLPDGRTTICQLTLDNGFTVDGHSACADPANFNKELGEQYAKKQAMDKAWGYLAFRLCDRMSLLAQVGEVPTEQGGQTYVGTKAVWAVPMTRQEYNDYRGWTLPADEDGSDEGYRVIYLLDGYTSWSPKGVFDASYVATDVAPSNYKLRLVSEALELSHKLGKLADFLKSDGFASLAQEDQQLLAQQALTMNQYLKVLNVRVVRASAAK